MLPAALASSRWQQYLRHRCGAAGYMWLLVLAVLTSHGLVLGALVARRQLAAGNCSLSGLREAVRARTALSLCGTVGFAWQACWVQSCQHGMATWSAPPAHIKAAVVHQQARNACGESRQRREWPDPE